jgi:hypothetical protein
MATRGWTSRVASSDPQAFRAPCTVIVDLRPRDAAVEAAAEVPRLNRRAVAGGEHQAGVDPGVSGTLPIGVLKLPAQLERGDAQVQCLELPLERRRRSIGWTLIAVAFAGRATGLAISVGERTFPKSPERRYMGHIRSRFRPGLL